jgi:hypothetical protein
MRQLHVFPANPAKNANLTKHQYLYRLFGRGFKTLYSSGTPRPTDMRFFCTYHFDLCREGEEYNTRKGNNSGLPTVRFLNLSTPLIGELQNKYSRGHL